MKLFHSVLMGTVLAGGTFAGAATLPGTPIAARPVSESTLTRLPGNTHPLARPENDLGKLDAEFRLDRVRLVLKRSPERQAALDSFVQRLYDRKSSDFHKFVSATQFGKTYGITDAELARVTGWLKGHGLSVTSVDKGRNFLQFSGTAAQVNETFNLEMHRYQAEGKLHIANDRDPQIPAELAKSVVGVASLHDFFPQPQHVFGGKVVKDPVTGRFRRVRPDTASQSGGNGATSATATSGSHDQFTYTDGYENPEADITPYDFATIYNVTPLWNAGITGSGQKIAISASTDINLNDVVFFRTQLGLPANAPVVVHNGTDPGITDSDSQGENTLDVEWSGAVAYNATIYLVVSGSTSTTFGGDLSNEYIVDNEIAPVSSASYGSCEIALGDAGNAANNQLYEQAASEGIASFESAGDQGSAGCDGHGGTAPYGAKYGVQVNGDASTPYETAVGGTDFNWYGNFNEYWSSTNAPSTYNSALGYIPEIPWNSTCASPFVEQQFTFSGGTPDTEGFCVDAAESSDYDVLVNINAGSGGVSACTSSDGSTFASCSGGYAKPSWYQSGTGVPNDGKRDLPDVSLFASDGIPGPYDVGSAYIFCVSNNTNGGASTCDYGTLDGLEMQLVGGTSVSSPAMAGVMALVNQEVGASQGFANPVMYELFRNESASNCATTSVTNSGSCVFNDITQGNNAQACASGGYECTPENSGDAYGILGCCTSTVGYDETTGLGSVNAYNLATKWKALVTAAAATTTTLSVSPNPATINGNVDLSVTVKKSSGSGTPTGAVTFVAAGIPLSTVTLSNGTASLNGIQFSAAGTYSIVANYYGDASDKASVSNTVNEVIGAAAVGTTTTLSASPTSVASGGSVKFTATVKPASGSATPTGSVSFTLNGTNIGSGTLSSGTATLTSTVSLAAGTYAATATYVGATGFTGSTSTSINITVTSAAKVNTTTVFAVSPNPISVNATGTLTASVTKSSGSGYPTGTVTFYYATEAIAQATLSNGVAKASAQAAVPAGTYGLHAVYAGDSADNSSTSSTVNVVVQNASKSSTTVTGSASPNPVKPGAVITLTAQVTGGSSTPTGTVTFSYSGETLGSGTLSSGFTATGLQVPSVPAGVYDLLFSYGGDSTHAASSATVKVTVN